MTIPLKNSNPGPKAFNRSALEMGLAALCFVLGTLGAFFQAYGWVVLLLANLLLGSGFILLIHAHYLPQEKTP
jgi:hypothetical protein